MFPSVYYSGRRRNSLIEDAETASCMEVCHSAVRKSDYNIREQNCILFIFENAFGNRRQDRKQWIAFVRFSTEIAQDIV